MFREYKQAVLSELIGKKYAITNTDLDGLLSLAIVQHYYPEVKFGGWYTNSNLTIMGEGKQNEYVGLDISFGKNFNIASISNHVEIDCTGISCNEHISEGNYYDKSMFSTSLLLLASIDKERIKNMTDEQIIMLMSIDATYQGFYKNGGRYRDKIVGYLRAYGLDSVVEVLERTDYIEFKTVQDKYGLYNIGKISGAITEDKLFTQSVQKVFEILGFNLPDISGKARVIVIGKWNKCNLYQYNNLTAGKLVMSNVMPYRGVVYYTTLVEVRHVK